MIIGAIIVGILILALMILREYIRERCVGGFEDLFSVSNKGQIFSKRTNKVLKQNPVSKGYNACMTRIGGRGGKCVLDNFKWDVIVQRFLDFLEI